MNTSLACVAMIVASLLSSSSNANASTLTESVLASFTGTNGNGPSGGLIYDAKGNLYGTTAYGGTAGDGVVFKLAPPAAGKTAWAETILYSFNKTNGSQPVASLIFDTAGNLYGVTAYGGASDDGVVFKLTPPAAGKTAWIETVLASFNGTNGAYPSAGLIFDGAGNLYGTTVQGGKHGDGVVFKLASPASGKTAWTETVLASFNGTNGAYPVANLVFDSAGNLYGVTISGWSSGDGTVFKVTPPAAGKTAWTETVIASFTGGANGASPDVSPIFDAKGNLYCATSKGGKYDDGVVFKLIPPAAGKTAWIETVLASFNGTNGSNPYAALVFDTKGNLYGATSKGGTHNDGTAFKLSPPSAGKTTWSETILADFNGTNGAAPQSGLILDANGNLYGTTSAGGSSGDGVVYKLTQ